MDVHRVQEHPATNKYIGGPSSVVASPIDKLSQGVSRRSVLARFGRLALVVLGVSVTEQALPVFQRVAEATHTPCHYWYLCQFEGFKCACASCSGDVNECPSCARVGGNWTGCCCCNGSGDRQLVTYSDCFKDNCSWAHVNDCNNNCTPCDHVPEAKTQLYGGTNPYYMCTRVRLGGNCTGHPEG
jgi:hypothetical protein